jgi:Mor family transcriptional regulator
MTDILGPGDVLAFIVTETLRQQGGLPAEQVKADAARIIPALRAVLGGDRYYIPRTPGQIERDQMLQDAMTNMPTAEVQRRHGVSRSTIYRLLKVHANGR